MQLQVAPPGGIFQPKGAPSTTLLLQKNEQHNTTGADDQKQDARFSPLFFPGSFPFLLLFPKAYRGRDLGLPHAHRQLPLSSSVGTRGAPDVHSAK